MSEAKVVILGGGPGAVFAYYGALYAGYTPRDIQIWAKGLTYPPGAFWLHQIPMNSPVTFQPVEMLVQGVGSSEGYSRKQWGGVFPNSFDTYTNRKLNVYNPVQVLPELWKRANVIEMEVKWTLPRIELLAASVDNLIVTFPVTPEALVMMAQREVPVYTATTQDKPEFATCLYSGLEFMQYVRLTRAFGRLSIEYPSTYVDRADQIVREENMHYGLEGTVQFVPELHPSVKPLRETVIGPRKNILLTGRWATLRRSALSHDSWTDTVQYLARGEGAMAL